MKIVFDDYATAAIKKYSKIALDIYTKQGMKKFKINRVLFDFTKEEKNFFFTESQNTKYKFTIEE